MKDPELLAREAMDNHYGLGAEWEEPNQYGEDGFTRAQAESDIDADQILGIIQEAINVDRAQRQVKYTHIDTMLAAWGEFEGDDVSTFIQEWTDRLNGEYA